MLIPPRARRLLLALALLAPTLALARPAAAEDAIRVVAGPAEQNNFPDGMAFSLDVESAAEIKEVRFRYTFLPENRSSSAQAEFEPGTRVHAVYTLRSGTATRYIPPGKAFRYSWEVRDAAGNELTLPTKETSFADPRFDWKSASDGNVTVNYYSDRQRDAEVMALVARETIDKAGQLMGTSFEFPIKIWAYANRRDFQIAVAHESVSSDPGVLGQAHEPDTFILVVDRLSSPSALDTARHELTHLVTAHALSKGPYQGLYPSWLNEGTSVYMQVSPNDVGYVDALDKAVKEDTVIPLKSLTAGTRNRNVGLFYGEGYAVVKFLVETYGAPKFAEMITAFNSTGQLDDAFEQAYGTDQTGIYEKWRESVGLKAEQARPDDQPGDAPAQASGSSNNEMMLAIVGSAALLGLLAVAVVAGLLLARRARSAG